MLTAKRSCLSQGWVPPRIAIGVGRPAHPLTSAWLQAPGAMRGCGSGSCDVGSGVLRTGRPPGVGKTPESVNPRYPCDVVAPVPV